MKEAELGSSKPSQFSMAFPPFRRSHLRSHTYNTLVQILSHLSAYNTSLQTPTQPLGIPDNGSGRMEQENQDKEPKCSEFVDSDFLDHEDPIRQKEIQEVQEIIEGVGDKDMDFTSNKMILDDIEHTMEIEEMSTKANGFDKEQKLMDELELVVKGTEDLVCDSGLIPLNFGLDEKHNDGCEVGLMDFQVDVEFLDSEVNSSGNASLLQEPEELNQLASEGFDMTSLLNLSASTKGQASAPVIGTSSSKHESQQKETELVKSVCVVVGSPTTTKEGGLEKEDGISEILKCIYHSVQDEGEKLDKQFCMNNATNSSNILIEKGDMEEGEISGDLGTDGNSFYVSSADALILQQMEVDEVQKPENVTGNMIYPSNIENQEKEKGCDSNSSVVNSIQDVNNSGQVEPRTCGKKGIACGVEVTISQETIECEKAGVCGSVLKPENSEDGHIGCKGIDSLLTNLNQNQVFHRDFLEENAAKNHGNTSAVKLVDASRKRKHDPRSDEKEDKKLVNASKKNKRGPGNKEKKKMKCRKKRAEKNRELGVKSLQLQHVQKPKIVSHCRHYLKGRCQEGDKCQFSHDIVPLTKSKPCTHFARHSCMKGDDCPFDHQLSKYPCNKFVSKGFCGRGGACLFSHQVPTNKDIPTPSNVSRPELKSPHLSGNANFSTPLNNHGSSSVQQSHFTNSAGIHSCINVEHKVTDSILKQPTPPKGISFINLAKLSPSPSTPKQGTVTTKESPVQIGTREDQSAFDKTQNKVEIPKKLPSVTPKGINFLSFGKGSVCSFRNPIRSNENRENGIKLPQFLNFGLPKQTSSSLNKDDHNKASDRTNVPQTDIFLNDILDKNESVTEGMKSKFPEITSVDVFVRDHNHSKSVQEGKKPSDNSQSSDVTSATLHPFVSNQSSECLISGYHKQASTSGQRALLSTLAFAAEHQFDIKMKCPTSGSPV